MSIRIGLTHRTSYTYDRKIQMGPQIIRLRPAPHCRTPIVSYSQTVLPRKHYLNWQQDPFGNYQARVLPPDPTDHFSVQIDVVADMVAINPFDFFLDDEVEHVPFAYEADLKKDLLPYLETNSAGERLKALVAEAKALWKEGEKREFRTVDFLVAINQMIEQRVGYIVRMEPGVQSPEETLTLEKGSCRDSSWLLVNVLRRLGVAARFVSGYLVQLTADDKPVDGPSGPESDFTDLHAWVEVFVPGAGWIGLDPTSGLFVSEGHIPLAATPSPSAAAPISGVLEKCEVEFDFEMKVERLREPPRISRPVTVRESEAIEVAGQKVDELLEKGDVRLTMGGEPTFLASNDRDAEEWTTAAVGPTKRDYADKLIRRLRDKFAPGGLLTHGQGKWYPGEPLPRWAFGLYWRNDGEPVWRNEERIGTEKTDKFCGSDEARKFASTLASQLNLADDFAQPAYEDPADVLVSEGNLPPNLDPEHEDFDDDEERRRLAQIFSEGMTKPKAFVIPIQQAQDVAQRGRAFKWLSEIWETRRGHLFLVPGDSPAGFRLPLKSLPYISEEMYPHVSQVDPFAQMGPLPSRRRAARPTMQTPTQEVSADSAQQAETDILKPGAIDVQVRTAMTIEHRNGELSVFLPPTTSVDAFIDLVTAIEETSEATGLPIRLEGYPPPRDPRLNEVKVTPDPGVIEVNIHPSASWKELSHVTRTLYEEAKACGLDASSFLVNGRPTGSGGGAHIVLGGKSAPDSPFLRRPDLLGSVIRFWQNHPSLSYLFAGTFIGPTSQAPRIDEARHDQLYEMELALAQLPPFGEDVPPWLVDRLFRHMLVDVTGNTHRSEICIDKLYSPDGPTGRLGLVEFRAFEMPPHADMNLAQQLLLRALIAWFWETPYEESLIPFGTALNDRYMLPNVLWSDLQDVVQKVSKGTGITIDPDWFRAHFEFRFPFIGKARIDDVTLELRLALEQWNVLGEEGAVGGTARFVDSSMERLQIEVIGDLGDKIVTCNGHTLPLTPWPNGRRQVAGVRFRTWLPSSCLHPTIPEHGPLVFDVYDPGIGRSVGGCTYFPTHPGGRNLETRPINALEAEGRRLASFADHGHTPGQMTPVTLPDDPRFPMTLDLRRSKVRA